MGFVSASDALRRRLTGSGSDRRSEAWFERKWSSRALHRLGELTSHAGAGLAAVSAVLLWLGVGWVKSFPAWWEATLYATSSSITLVMVFAIQHTQARQQAAIQRKLLTDLNIEDRDRSAP